MAHDASHGHGGGHEDHGGAESGTPGVKNVAKKVGLFERLYLPALAMGLEATVRHFFSNAFGRRKYVHTVTYPDKPVVYPVRFRGMHRLVPREDGAPRCVACFMCQTVCPARCIHIVAGETDDKSIEKFPKVFEIDELRCVVCGLCVEACPCDAIRMDTGIHPKPVYTRDDALFERNDLLAMLGRHEANGRKNHEERPPPSAAGTGRVDRSTGDRGAGGSSGGY